MFGFNRKSIFGSTALNNLKFLMNKLVEINIQIRLAIDYKKSQILRIIQREKYP